VFQKTLCKYKYLDYNNLVLLEWLGRAISLPRPRFSLQNRLQTCLDEIIPSVNAGSEFAGNGTLPLVYKEMNIVNHAWIAAVPKRMEMAT